MVTEVLVTAINDAATSGRNGLGAVVLWALRNEFVFDCQTVAGDDFPPVYSMLNVISVGGSDSTDSAIIAGHGPCMDVLAPTTAAPPGGTGTGHLVTTDLTGCEGYNDDDTLYSNCIDDERDEYPDTTF